MAKKTTQVNFRLADDTLDAMDFVARRLGMTAGVELKRVDGVRVGMSLAKRSFMPLIGEIGAGVPKNVPADQNEYLQVNSLYPDDAAVFRVRGDSMRDDCIADGDYVVVRPGDDADNGDTIVIHLSDDGVVIKRYDKEKGLIYCGVGKGRWERKLKPGDRILGTYIGLIRRA
jgi:repressor LexA